MSVQETNLDTTNNPEDTEIVTGMTRREFLAKLSGVAAGVVFLPGLLRNSGFPERLPPTPSPIPSNTATLVPSTPTEIPTATATETAIPAETIRFGPTTRVFPDIPDILAYNNQLGNITGEPAKDTELVYDSSLFNEDGNPFVHRFLSPQGKDVWILSTDIPQDQQIREFKRFEGTFDPLTQIAIPPPAEGETHDVLAFQEGLPPPDNPAFTCELGNARERRIHITSSLEHVNESGLPIPVPPNKLVGLSVRSTKYEPIKENTDRAVFWKSVDLSLRSDGLYFSQSFLNYNPGIIDDFQNNLDLERIDSTSTTTLDIIAATLSADGSFFELQYRKPDGSVGYWSKQLRHPLTASTHSITTEYRGDAGLFIRPHHHQIQIESSPKSLDDIPNPGPANRASRQELLALHDLSSVLPNNRLSIPILGPFWADIPNFATLLETKRVKRLNLLHSGALDYGKKIAQFSLTIDWAHSLERPVDLGVSLNTPESITRSYILESISERASKVDAETGDLFWFQDLIGRDGNLSNDFVLKKWGRQKDQVYEDIAKRLDAYGTRTPVPAAFELPEDFEFSDLSIADLNQTIASFQQAGVDLKGVSVKATTTHAQIDALRSKLGVPVIGVYELANHSKNHPNALSVSDWLQWPDMILMLADPYLLSYLNEPAAGYLIERSEFPVDDDIRPLRLGTAYPIKK